MPWYRTGTVAITAGQTTVTGTGTNFSANARVGDALLGPDGNWYEVSNIASATVLSILPAYKGVTVASGTYAIAPVQGYTKTLADKFNDIANTWGSTLAGLGAVSTENVVPVNKGGTGGNTAALGRAGLGLKSAAVADILGTVSQIGGVPTGAIVERGSNANGDYVKFADGTLICIGSLTVSGASWSSSSTTNRYYKEGGSKPFASTFSGVPKVFTTTLDPVIGGRSCWCSFVSANSASITSIYLTAVYSGGNFADVPVDFLAIGRWF
ncbi:phage tail protein [Pseudomonas hunanensis]|uniref:phage tail protein n=1 Tax=Pseudomonas hunanensis TaxID=1247546 RepID=UPI003D039D21